VGEDCECEEAVFFGVVVAGVDQGVGGECGELLEGVVHCFHVCFEDSAAASGEEGVAGEEQGRDGGGGGYVAADAGFGVAGGVEDRYMELADLYGWDFVGDEVDSGYAGVGCDDAAGGVLFEVGDGGSVVVVVVGDEDVGEGESMGVEGCENGWALAGVDGEGFVFLVWEEVDEVVAECGQNDWILHVRCPLSGPVSFWLAQ